MKVTSTAFAVVAILASSWAIDRFTVAAQVNSNDNRISVMDNCDPTDPTWPGGGCSQKPHLGDVNLAEFNGLLSSTLSTAVIGHPSWRNEPPFISTSPGRTVRVTNTGGRNHSFTEVAQFGAGVTPAPLNVGLSFAPECGSFVNLPPGGTQDVTLTTTGTHKFQCCFHPWMRAAIEIK